ncbi:cytochrome-b5 reductase [Saprolegnia diclina VS20]|uniref:Cytochrome-b5 reductase n=1 Tax=Saprolegnia diclina (strain VS20) TaxID=1156394 RepID=T0Q6X8_SAPDV|nr:cytochrome-b5 reductase [Saprolegnia diclina VS20]EQC29225.1 cytochrome-b5 reductase [Saprolegnia diclina VS20]|eukprot:XP_008617403.1 cytochrome-b5 reductase [Saprolegnia diclina VS20]
MASLTVYTMAEVAAHTQIDDCWIIVGETGAKKVYDVTKFSDDHPGGADFILNHAGKDATSLFELFGHSTDARKTLAKYLIGVLDEDDVPAP